MTTSSEIKPTFRGTGAESSAAGASSAAAGTPTMTQAASGEALASPPLQLDAERPLPSVGDYAAVGAALSVFIAALAVVVYRGAGVAIEPARMIDPVMVLMLLVFAVWVVMLAVRNYAVLNKITSGLYYYSYRDDEPPDWVERPARVFNNLMQLPTVFYALAILMLVTERVDAAQLGLGWVFVSTRVAHAIIYAVWNHLPARFGSYVAGVLALMALFGRFAFVTR